MVKDYQGFTLVWISVLISLLMILKHHTSSCDVRNDVISIITNDRYKSNMSTAETFDFIRHYFNSIEIVRQKTSTTLRPKVSTTTSAPPSSTSTEMPSSSIHDLSEPPELDTGTEPSPSVTIIPVEPSSNGQEEVDSKGHVLNPMEPVIRWSSFTCNDKSHGGYYADMASQCKYFHICVFNSMFNLLTRRTEVRITKFRMQCPAGTAYSQLMKVCDFQENVEPNCQRSHEHFHHESFY